MDLITLFLLALEMIILGIVQFEVLTPEQFCSMLWCMQTGKDINTELNSLSLIYRTSN